MEESILSNLLHPSTPLSREGFCFNFALCDPSLLILIYKRKSTACKVPFTPDYVKKVIDKG